MNRFNHAASLFGVARDCLAEPDPAAKVAGTAAAAAAWAGGSLGPAPPAGRVGGAPEARPMQPTDDLEPPRRGPYAGAVGYVDFAGNLDTCITIRTVVLKDGTAYVQAGAGIVADSRPDAEEEETRNKAGAVLAAIRAAEVLHG